MRYADDMVVLARRWKPELTEYIESRLEGKFQLEINRDKTRIVDLKEERGQPSLSGIHVSVRLRPERANEEVPESVSVGKGAAKGAGEATS